MSSTCPVCRKQAPANTPHCTQCGWVLELSVVFVSSPPKDMVALENESLNLRTQQWQELQSTLSQIDEYNKTLEQQIEERTQRGDLHEKQRAILAGLKKESADLEEEVEKLQQQLNEREKASRGNTRLSYEDIGYSILPAVEEKGAEIIEIRSQLVLPNVLYLIFEGSDDLERYQILSRSQGFQLVVGIHHHSRIYEVPAADFIYKLPVNQSGKHIRLNGRPALEMRLPFKLNTTCSYVIANYSSMASYRAGIFCCIDLPGAVSKRSN